MIIFITLLALLIAMVPSSIGVLIGYFMFSSGADWVGARQSSIKMIAGTMLICIGFCTIFLSVAGWVPLTFFVATALKNVFGCG